MLLTPTQTPTLMPQFGLLYLIDNLLKERFEWVSMLNRKRLLASSVLEARLVNTYSIK